MTATVLRDELVRLATAIKNRSASPDVDGWALNIIALANLIPETVPNVIERRLPNRERRLADQDTTFQRRADQRRR